MSTPEPDFQQDQQELLRSITTILKGIQSSLDHLTAAVEGVAESIEKAHEPEGDLGFHLVSALKDLSSALHKRATLEHAPQARNSPQRSQHPKRDDRPVLRQDQRPDLRAHHPDTSPERFAEEHEERTPPDPVQSGESDFDTATPASVPLNHQGIPSRKPRPNRNRRGKNGGRAENASTVQDHGSGGLPAPLVRTTPPVL